MKRRIPILSTASVFFIALILLVSCGIATRFYIDSSIKKAEPSVSDSVAGTYSVNSDPLNNLSWIDVGSGPSVMLFYLITDEPNPPSGIVSTFNSTYQKNYAGIAISSDEILTGLSALSSTFFLYQRYRGPFSLPVSDLTAPGCMAFIVTPDFLNLSSNTCIDKS